MPLTLQVASYHSQAMGPRSKCVLEKGGTIGRSPDNDWVLPDPDRIVSSNHAEIAFDRGTYILTDRSTNGTVVNGQELSHGSSVELRSGDRLLIGEYEVLVSIANDPSTVRTVPSMDSSDFFDTRDAGSHRVAVQSNGNSDPLDFFDANRSESRQAERMSGTSGDDSPAEQECIVPPGTVADPLKPSFAAEIPENWGDEKPALEQSQEHRSHQEVESGRQASSQASRDGATAPMGRLDEDIRQLLERSGLDPAEVNSATLGSLGEIIRVVVEGLIDVLNARAEIKNQFRLEKTMLRPRENNPLKLSVNATDALFNLFCKRDSSYLDPVEAFREAFDDLKSHQMATMSGIRAAYNQMLQRFDPEALQDLFNRGGMRSTFIEAINKTKYWDLYQKMYRELGNDDATFRRMFGNEFARAYEEQLQRLARVKSRDQRH